VIHLRQGNEVEAMRRAGHTAAEVLRLTAASVRAGISTADVDRLAAALIRERGCTSAFLGYRNFPGTICISLNDEVVHGIGRAARVIRDGDIVKLDVGIIQDGWVGDNALTVPVGEVPPETWSLLQAAEDSLDAAIALARHHGSLRDLCGAVEKVVTRRGFSVVRQFVGHGVGRRLHEEPQVPNWADPSIRTKLKAGMILAIEPMINAGRGKTRTLADNWTAVTIDGKASAHFEHTVLVTSGDPEILTPRQRLTAPLEPAAAG
jgi:methionyl aminopeptidase